MVKFKVSDMTCEGCAGKIRKALEASEQIGEIKIDVPGHKVNVTGSADEETVAELIRSAGYTPEPISTGFFRKLLGKS